MLVQPDPSAPEPLISSPDEFVRLALAYRPRLAKVIRAAEGASTNPNRIPDADLDDAIHTVIANSIKRLGLGGLWQALPVSKAKAYLKTGVKRYVWERLRRIGPGVVFWSYDDERLTNPDDIRGGRSLPKSTNPPVLVEADRTRSRRVPLDRPAPDADDALDGTRSEHASPIPARSTPAMERGDFLIDVRREAERLSPEHLAAVQAILSGASNDEAAQKVGWGSRTTLLRRMRMLAEPLAEYASLAL
jgi:hypothetical protein